MKPFCRLPIKPLSKLARRSWRPVQIFAATTIVFSYIPRRAVVVVEGETA
jgi:hypothetical protein